MAIIYISQNKKEEGVPLLLIHYNKQEKHSYSPFKD